MIQCKTAKLEQQQIEILYEMRDINNTLNKFTNSPDIEVTDEQFEEILKLIK